MKQEQKINFCFLCCFLSCVLALLMMVVTTLEMQEVRRENDFLKCLVQKSETEIQKQNKTIDIYKQHCDDVARCIVNGEW